MAEPSVNTVPLIPAACCRSWKKKKRASCVTVSHFQAADSLGMGGGAPWDTTKALLQQDAAHLPGSARIQYFNYSVSTPLSPGLPDAVDAGATGLPMCQENLQPAAAPQVKHRRRRWRRTCARWWGCAMPCAAWRAWPPWCSTRCCTRARRRWCLSRSSSQPHCHHYGQRHASRHARQHHARAVYRLVPGKHSLQVHLHGWCCFFDAAWA